MPPPVPELLEPTTTLRRLRADEAPYPGQFHADPRVVWVDVDLVPDALWQCAPEGNLLVPVDIARTPTGHAAIMPHCAERLASVIDGLTGDGVRVTIAVSMLRAAAEAHAHRLASGSWWVDASGRPVLAVGSTAPWALEAGDLLARLSEGASGPLSAALARAGDLITSPRITDAAVLACEDALFEVAEPVPLGEGARTREDMHAPRLAETFRRDGATVPAESWIARFTDTEWATRVVAAARSVSAAPALLRERRSQRKSSARRGSPPRESPRRRPCLVAAAVGATIVAAGLLWPTPPATTGARAVPDTVSTGSILADESARGEDPATPGAPRQSDEPSAGPVSLDTVALRAIAAIGECTAAGALTCASVMEDPAAATPTGLVAAGVAETTVTLLDEYGGVAVLRVEAEHQPAQILVLVSADGKWLVRDIYDVADQP